MRSKQIVILFDEFIKYKSLRVGSNTIDNYFAVRKNLHEFLSVRNHYRDIKDIRIPFMRDFNDVMYHRFSPAHTKRILNCIVAFCKWCVNMELLEFNAVRDYQVEVPKVKSSPVSLTLLELNKIENFIPGTLKLENIKDLFLFQCYTGLSYSDIEYINENCLFEQEGKFYLVGARKKTDIDFTAPVNEKAMNLLKKYNFALPILSNQKYNQYLKELGGCLGIEKKLTTHVGRRTCGQLHLDLGFTIEAVSRMLGHADIKTTQKHYARASFERVHNENLRIVA